MIPSGISSADVSNCLNFIYDIQTDDANYVSLYMLAKILKIPQLLKLCIEEIRIHKTRPFQNFHDLLLEKIKRDKGVTATVYGVEGLTSKSLIDSSTHYIAIDEEFLL